MKTTIAVATANYTYTRPYPGDVYEINPEGRFVWLQRLAQRILARYGKNPVSTILSYRTETIEVDTVLAALAQLLDNATQIMDDDQFVAIVGAKEWAEIRRSADAEVAVPLVSYNLPVPERLAHRFIEYRLRNMRGLRVIVVAWHHGITILPEKLVRYL